MSSHNLTSVVIDCSVPVRQPLDLSRPRIVETARWPKNLLSKGARVDLQEVRYPPAPVPFGQYSYCLQEFVCWRWL